MKALRTLVALVLTFATCALIIGDAMAESRTLTTRIMVTVRDPNLQPAAPKGLEDIYAVALSQNISQRIVKTEPSLSPVAGPRYTMTEKL